MKKVLVLIFVFVLCGSVFAAEKPWTIAVDDESLLIREESVLITVGNLSLKAHRCGQVQVQEWKEIVPNKDRDITLFTSSTGSVTLSIASGDCRVVEKHGFSYLDCEPTKPKLPDWKISVGKAAFTISGEKDEALIDLNKGVTKLKVTRDGEVKHLVPEKWVKVK